MLSTEQLRGCRIYAEGRTGSIPPWRNCQYHEGPFVDLAVIAIWSLDMPSLVRREALRLDLFTAKRSIMILANVVLSLSQSFIRTEYVPEISRYCQCKRIIIEIMFIEILGDHDPAMYFGFLNRSHVYFIRSSESSSWVEYE